MKLSTRIDIPQKHIGLSNRCAQLIVALRSIRLLSEKTLESEIFAIPLSTQLRATLLDARKDSKAILFDFLDKNGISTDFYIDEDFFRLRANARLFGAYIPSVTETRESDQQRKISFRDFLEEKFICFKEHHFSLKEMIKVIAESHGGAHFASRWSEFCETIFPVFSYCVDLLRFVANLTLNLARRRASIFFSGAYGISFQLESSPSAQHVLHLSGQIRNLTNTIVCICDPNSLVEVSFSLTYDGRPQVDMIGAQGSLISMQSNSGIKIGSSSGVIVATWQLDENFTYILQIFHIVEGVIVYNRKFFPEALWGFSHIPGEFVRLVGCKPRSYEDSSLLFSDLKMFSVTPSFSSAEQALAALKDQQFPWESNILRTNNVNS